MYRVEWMKKGWKTLFWDCFATMELAVLYVEGLKENADTTLAIIVTPWETFAH